MLPILFLYDDGENLLSLVFQRNVTDEHKEGSPDAPAEAIMHST